MPGENRVMKLRTMLVCSQETAAVHGSTVHCFAGVCDGEQTSNIYPAAFGSIHTLTGNRTHVGRALKSTAEQRRNQEQLKVSPPKNEYLNPVFDYKVAVQTRTVSGPPPPVSACSGGNL